MRCWICRAFAAALFSMTLFNAVLLAQARFADADVGLSDLEPSEAALIAASGTLQPDHEIIARMAWRMRKIRHSQILDGVRAGGGNQSSEFLIDPKIAQFRPVTVWGRLEKLQRWTELDPTAVPPFWRLQIVMESGRTVMAVVSAVPELWMDAAMPIENVAVSGLVVGPVDWKDGETGFEGDTESPPVWLVAGQRASWFPDFENVDSGLDAGIRALAESGFDAAWLDEIRRAGSRPMTAGEREAFEAYVESVASITEDVWQRLQSAGETGSIVDLLKNAQRATGFPVSIEGQVRRVTELPGGLQQVELFVETGTRGVVVTNSAGERLRFESRMPVTVDMPAGSGDVSELDGARVRIDGFVYRFWTYQSAFAEEQGATSGQTVPLVVGWRMIRPEYGQQTFDRALQFMILGLLGFVGLVVVIVLRMNRADQRRREQRREAQRPKFD